MYIEYPVPTFEYKMDSYPAVINSYTVFATNKCAIFSKGSLLPEYSTDYACGRDSACAGQHTYASVLHWA